MQTLSNSQCIRFTRAKIKHRSLGVFTSSSYKRARTNRTLQSTHTNTCEEKTKTQNTMTTFYKFIVFLGSPESISFVLLKWKKKIITVYLDSHSRWKHFLFHSIEDHMNEIYVDEFFDNLHIWPSIPF